MSALRQSINEHIAAPTTVSELLVHYIRHELPRKALSTAEGYRIYFRRYIEPKWGSHPLITVRAVEVERWLESLRDRKGAPLAPGTRAKIRNILSAIFSHAVRHQLTTSNPIAGVRTSAKRQRVPEFLSPDELRALLSDLDPREHTMVLLVCLTGLRRGELMALRWQDIDFAERQVNVTRSVWRNHVGRTKTPGSAKPVPLPSCVSHALSMWRSQSPYAGDSDYVFPSLQRHGKQPLQPDMLLKRHIRPALKRLQIEKTIGWHSLRHGLATMLRQLGADIKTSQDILRHANSRITVDLYQQTVSSERREAQRRVMEVILPTTNEGAEVQHPSAPSFP